MFREETMLHLLLQEKPMGGKAPSQQYKNTRDLRRTLASKNACRLAGQAQLADPGEWYGFVCPIVGEIRQEAVKKKQKEKILFRIYGFVSGIRFLLCVLFAIRNLN